jgi:hypothetical protein
MAKLARYFLITSFFLNADFVYSSAYQDVDSEDESIVGVSGFLHETELKMEELGYPYQDFNPIENQIKNQYQPEYGKRYEDIYNSFSAIIRGVHEYYYDDGYKAAKIDAKLSSLNGDFTFSSRNDGYITFQDAEDFLILPLLNFISEKMKQYTHGGDNLTESIRNASIESYDTLEQAQKTTLQNICKQTYEVWFLLMFRSAFEEETRRTIQIIQEKLEKKEHLSESVPILEEKQNITTNTDEESRNYQEVISRTNKAIETLQNEVDALDTELKDNWWNYLCCLRKPNDTTYRKGYGTQHGIINTITYALGGEHPRVKETRELIYPLIRADDVQWGHDRLRAGMGSYWEEFKDGLEIEIPYEKIFITNRDSV